MKSIAAAVAFIALGASTYAEAQVSPFVTCTLGVSSENIAVGQPFSFSVDLFAEPPEVEPGVPPFGPRPPFGPFSVVFFGTKNGVDDIGPGGYTDPRPIYYGVSVLDGYGNPGGLTGTYVRFAHIRDGRGRTICVTNAVSTFLQ
jgi:hypothetical protein